MTILPDLDFNALYFHLRGLIHSPYIQIFFFLMWVDIATGYLKAFKTKRFDSKTGTLGLLRHVLVLFVIIIVAMYARALGIRPFGVAWCLFFIVNYIGSILENWEIIGIGFPEWLKPYINQVKKDSLNRFATTLKVDTIEVKSQGKKGEDNGNS